MSFAHPRARRAVRPDHDRRARAGARPLRRPAHPAAGARSGCGAGAQPPGAVERPVAGARARRTPGPRSGGRVETASSACWTSGGHVAAGADQRDREVGQRRRRARPPVRAGAVGGLAVDGHHRLRRRVPASSAPPASRTACDERARAPPASRSSARGVARGRRGRPTATIAAASCGSTSASEEWAAHSVGDAGCGGLERHQPEALLHRRVDQRARRWRTATPSRPRSTAPRSTTSRRRPGRGGAPRLLVGRRRAARARAGPRARAGRRSRAPAAASRRARARTRGSCAGSRSRGRAGTAARPSPARPPARSARRWPGSPGGRRRCGPRGPGSGSTRSSASDSRGGVLGEERDAVGLGERLARQLAVAVPGREVLEVGRVVVRDQVLLGEHDAPAHAAAAA